mmetsp:Transcript_7082/g.5041  ORF Transcript_7082/g.5041 Transcript_7082/m.5041 type:complete len:101 (+) Transcript_7082:291-593(+)
MPKLMNAFCRMFTHQLVLGLWQNFVFLSVMGLLKTNFNVEKSKEYLCEKYFSVLKVSWMFWPPIVMMGYGYIPMQYMNLYFDFFGFIYANCLSYVNNNKV